MSREVFLFCHLWHKERLYANGEVLAGLCISFSVGVFSAMHPNPPLGRFRSVKPKNGLSAPENGHIVLPSVKKVVT